MYVYTQIQIRNTNCLAHNIIFGASLEIINNDIFSLKIPQILEHQFHVCEQIIII